MTRAGLIVFGTIFSFSTLFASTFEGRWWGVASEMLVCKAGVQPSLDVCEWKTLQRARAMGFDTDQIDRIKEKIRINLTSENGKHSGNSFRYGAEHEVAAYLKDCNIAFRENFCGLFRDAWEPLTMQSRGENTAIFTSPTAMYVFTRNPKNGDITVIVAEEKEAGTSRTMIANFNKTRSHFWAGLGYGLSPL